MADSQCRRQEQRQQSPPHYSKQDITAITPPKTLQQRQYPQQRVSQHIQPLQHHTMVFVVLDQFYVGVRVGVVGRVGRACSDGRVILVGGGCSSGGGSGEAGPPPRIPSSGVGPLITPVVRSVRSNGLQGQSRSAEGLCGGLCKGPCAGPPEGGGGDGVFVGKSKGRG